MKVLVLSDSHGDVAKVRAVLERTRGEIDVIIHCGDGDDDLDRIQDIPLKPSFRVSGNAGCDSPVAKPKLELDLEGHRILVCHGHRYGVHDNLARLKLAAEEGKFDVVLFGHTHATYLRTLNGITYANPGSIARPRGDPQPTYAIMTLLDGMSPEIDFFSL